MRSSSPFTVSQWQELEHQALIFKYIIAGLPVPPDLVLPIQKTFENVSHRLFNHPSFNYCSLYGKKIDPEPGRCRRTDGKKWRCSKEAHPDSKYCERHMHRGRNRSRKPVESSVQTSTTSSYSSSLSSTVTSSFTVPVGGNAGNYHSLPLHSFDNMQRATASVNNNHSTYNVDSIPFGVPSKDYRYMQVQELKPESVEHRFFSGVSDGNKSVQTNLLENSDAWSVMQSNLQNSNAHNSSFLNIDFASGETTKHDGQSLRPFLDEWPKTRTSWSGIEDDRSNQYTTTQLSMSIPMGSSAFSTANSHSPHG